MSCGSPVVEVHDSLESVPSPCGDVALKARKQRGDHVHAVLLTLPVRKHTSVKTPMSSCEKQKRSRRREKTNHVCIHMKPCPSYGHKHDLNKQTVRIKWSTCMLWGSFQWWRLRSCCRPSCCRHSWWRTGSDRTQTRRGTNKMVTAFRLCLYK